MIGQRITDATRVVVLVETPGRDHGWEVFNPHTVTWELVGVVDGSTHATMRVTGEFHRMSKSDDSRAIEAAMNQAAIDQPRRGELR